MLNTFIFSTKYLFKKTHTQISKPHRWQQVVKHLSAGKRLPVQKFILKQLRLEATSLILWWVFDFSSPKYIGLRLHLSQSNDRLEHTDTRVLSHSPFYAQQSTPGRYWWTRSVSNRTDGQDGICLFC